jgi:hypothetical protein
MADRAIMLADDARRGALRRIVVVMVLAALVYLAGNGRVALWDRD